MLVAFEVMAIIAALVAMVGMGAMADGVDVWLTPAAIAVILATWSWHRWRAHQWTREWRAAIGDLPVGSAALDALERGPLREAATGFRRSLLTMGGVDYRAGTSADFIYPGTDAEPELDGPPRWLANGHALLLSLGLLGTFLGLTIGLAAVNLDLGQGADVLTKEITELFSGAKLAFAKSVAGIAFSIIWSYRWRQVEREFEVYFERVVRTLDRAFPLHTPTHAIKFALEALAERTERAIVDAKAAAAVDAATAATLMREASQRQAADAAAQHTDLRLLGETLIGAFSPKLQEALENTLVPILTQVRDQGQTFGAAAAREMSEAMRAGQGEHLKGLSESFEKTTQALDRTQTVVVGNTDVLAQMLGGLQQQVDGLNQATRGLSVTLSATVTPLERIGADLDAARLALGATTHGLEAERASLVAATGLLRAGEEAVTDRFDNIAAALEDLLGKVTATGVECRNLLDATVLGTAAAMERRVHASGWSVGIGVLPSGRHSTQADERGSPATANIGDGGARGRVKMRLALVGRAPAVAHAYRYGGRLLRARLRPSCVVF